MRSLVIGGAGFIGSHLVDRLVERGPVVVIDNLSSGRREYVNPKAELCIHNIVDPLHLQDPFDVCFHLAANPDARHALTLTRTDLEQGTIATYNALEACRLAEIPRFVFSSSGTVYGDTQHVCSEHDLARLPVSLYGASKLAGEAMVSAFSACFGLKSYICRFGNVVGPRATHGCIVDFRKQLAVTPDRLRVLGNGTQTKPYLHVSDCVDAMLYILDHGGESNPCVYNVASEGGTSVREIAELVANGAEITYGEEPRGWPGDVPQSRLNPSLLAHMGWRVSMTSRQAVERAVRET